MNRRTMLEFLHSTSLPRAPRIGLASALLWFGLAGGSALTQEEAVPVEVTKAQRAEDVQRVFEATGTVTSLRRSRLSSRTEGLVSRLEVDAGSRVKEGEILMELDARLAEIELDLIRAELKGAEIELADAERRYEEVKELTESGGFARSEARSLEAAARIRRAAVKQLEAREARQLERIERHRLVAPYSGVIARKMTEAGEWVDTGTPVVELVETDRVRFDLQVPQELLAPVRDAESVTVTLDAWPEEPFEATISTVVPVKDDVSRTFLTRLDLVDPEGRASPGMSGEASLSWRSTAGASVTVPRDAVVRYPDGTAKVWVVAEEADSHRARSRSIRTAGALADWVEIFEGLEGGETVVVRGNEGLQEGQEVRIHQMELTQPKFAP